MAEIINLINTSLSVQIKEVYNMAGKQAEEIADLQETEDTEGLYYTVNSVYYFLVVDGKVQSWLIS